MTFTSSVYNGLKFIALVLLPAVATLYFALAEMWHLPDPDKVNGTIIAVDTFLGVVLHISTKKYNSDTKYDGEFVVDQAPDGSQSLRLKSIDYEALNVKHELLFKIAPPSITAQPVEPVTPPAS